MTPLANLVCATALAASASLVAGPACAQVAPAAPAITKNWTAPAHKMLAQKLCDEILAAHPELISVTMQGVPPGQQKVYTMFAGSFPERIGKASNPDDVVVITKGYTIVDPRYKRSDDTEKKVVVLTPLRDAAGENVGLLVLAYNNDASHSRSEAEFYLASQALRDELQKQIPSYTALFDPVK
jgi:hypothetical protein